MARLLKFIAPNMTAGNLARSVAITVVRKFLGFRTRRARCEHARWRQNYRATCDGAVAMAKSQTVVSTANKVFVATLAVSMSSAALADWVKVAATDKFTVYAD